MVFRILGIFSVIVLGLYAEEKFDLPVPTCKRNETNYSTCLKHAIKEAWPLFVKGLPAEFDFPPLDPLFYEYQKNVFDNGNIHGEISVTNLTVEGLSAARFTAVRPHFDDDAFRLEIDVRIPSHYIQGNCEAHGILGGIQMGGKGNFNLTLEGIKETWDISGVVKNDTWIIEHFHIFLTIRNLKISLYNFFDGNREMNELVTMFINEYWPQLHRVVLPIMENYWDPYFSELLTRLFSKLSFSKIFP